MSTVNGIGSFYYGNDDRHADGSQVATLFAVFFFMPLVPLGTYRIKKSSITGASMSVQRLQALPLHWNQVLLTYAKCWVLAPLAMVAPYALLTLLTRWHLTNPETSPVARFVLEWGWIYVIGMAAYLLGRARRS